MIDMVIGVSLSPEVAAKEKRGMENTTLQRLLQRSNEFHERLAEAVGELDEPVDGRASVTMDALVLSMQHADALRLTADAGLGASAMGLLRMQYEAVLRAVWALFAADQADITALAAPLTPGTLKAAKGIGMPAELLVAVERSEAPADLKRNLREFRTSSWDVLNSVVHAGLHPLRRRDGALDAESVMALVSSNGMAVIAAALMTIVGQRPKRQADINILWTAFTDCLPPRHMA